MVSMLGVPETHWSTASILDQAKRSPRTLQVAVIAEDSNDGPGQGPCDPSNIEKEDALEIVPALFGLL